VHYHGLAQFTLLSRLDSNVLESCLYLFLAGIVVSEDKIYVACLYN